MADINLRNYSHDRDIGLIAEIHQQCKKADQVDQLSSMETIPTTEEIKDNLHDDQCNPETDIIFSEIDGRTVGFTKVKWWNETTGVRLYLIDGLVIPDHRGKGVGLKQLQWAEKRAREIEESNNTPSTKPMFGANASTTQQDRATLLVENGYEITFSMVEMENSDLSSIKEYSVPGHFELRPVDDNHLRAIWEANIKFYENRDFVGEFDEEGYQEFIEQPNKDYSLWHVAWVGDEVAGVVISKIENDRAEITEVGVIPKYRRKGLAQALLSLNLKVLSEKGIKKARLHTSGENVSGAQNLYQNAGFNILKRFNRYRKPMS